MKPIMRSIEILASVLAVVIGMALAGLAMPLGFIAKGLLSAAGLAFEASFYFYGVDGVRARVARPRVPR